MLGTSCSNDLEIEMYNGKYSFNSIYASMGDLPTSRVHLENGGKVVWDINDQICVFSNLQTTPIQFRCTSTDKNKASFISNEKIKGDTFYAFYPYAESFVEGDSIKYSLPSYYDIENFTNSYFQRSPMIAKSNTNEFLFKHTCGVIRFSITGTKLVKSLSLEGNNNEIIAGTGYINLTNKTPILSIPPDAADASTSQWITMYPKQLSSIPTDFYFIVPIGEFTKGLTLRIFTSDDESYEVKKVTNKAITISRSVIKSFSTFDLDELIEQELEEEKQERDITYKTLMEFYNSTNGENWIDNTNWGSDKPFDEWYGVTVPYTNINTIHSIYLAYNNLSGYLPESITEFTELETLYLAYNNIGGTIPKEIDKLSKLYHIDLSFNRISGSIPNSICNLTTLHILGLANNRLTGMIPENIGNMVNLNTFNISNYSVGAGGGDVNINDSLPYCNQITGKIPLSLTTLPNLASFNADQNKLLGDIPNELWSMPSLTLLTLDGNMLTGAISPTIGKAKKLVQLWLRNNHLTGVIPEEICELTNLMELYIGNTNSGPIGEYSSYQYNKFEGSIPKNIGNLSCLIDLDMSLCGLSGIIPTSLYTMNKLNGFNLGNAGGEGNETIAQYYNHISGNISSAIVGMTNLSGFNIAGNEITGAIPKELGSLQSLHNINLSKNKITGSIPAELGNLQNLLYLELHENEIEGSIPKELGNLNKLELLSLSNNKISGTLPIELGNLQNLVHLHLGSNNIEGNIPKEYARLINLNSLHLYSNKMTGVIPEEITSSPMWSISRWYPEAWILPQQEGYGFTLDYGYYESSDYSKDGEVVTLQTASIGKGINLTFIGEAFVDKDMASDGLYEQKMNEAMEKYFSIEPYKSLRDRFNVYAIKVVSPNAEFMDGAKHRINLSDSICFEYAQKIPNASKNPPMVSVIYNTSFYTDRSYTTMYSDGSFVGYMMDGITNVLIHEAGGHGFANLLDEYVKMGLKIQPYPKTKPPSWIIYGVHIAGELM